MGTECPCVRTTFGIGASGREPRLTLASASVCFAHPPAPQTLPELGPGLHHSGNMDGLEYLGSVAPRLASQQASTKHWVVVGCLVGTDRMDLSPKITCPS